MKIGDFLGWSEPHAPVSPLAGGSEMPLGGEPRGQVDGHRDEPSSGRAPGEPEGEGHGRDEGSHTSADEGVRSSAASGSGKSEADFDSLVRIVSQAMELLDSRVVSTVALVAFALFVVGLSNLLWFVIVLFVGFVLLDRFSAVRRAISLGGSVWAIVEVAGDLFLRSSGLIYMDARYFFSCIGMLLAIFVCSVLFVGRALRDLGYRRGQRDADVAIARHMEERLIERPDEVGNLDPTFIEVEGALTRVRDRERRAEDALRDESRRKDDLVTYLAHDLKTPLASVVGYLSLLEEAPDLPLEQRARFTGIALEKAHRLDALIEEFFDITRFDFHDIVLTRGYVDLGLMLVQVVDEFYPTLAEQGKSAQVDAPDGLVVLIDGDKMARVFNNVMKNAIAYSYEGSTIRIAAVREESEEGSGIVVRFENQGDPIPAPKLSVIFEKFYRLDAARATNRGGAGLGLAIAKEIVGAHGGTIACESTPEHTVFTIRIPEEGQESGR